MTGAEHSDDTLRALLALAAVDALDADEQTELDAALADRPDLRAELDELRLAATLLGEAAAEPPPAHLRADVLAAIAATPQEPAGREATDDGPVTAVVTPLDRPTSRPRPRQRWLVAAAAAVVLVVGGAIALIVRDDTPDDPIAAVRDHPEATVMLLDGELGGLRMVYSPAHGDTVIVGDGVPPPPDGHTYELWLLAGDADPERVEIFRPHDDGTVAVLMAGMAPPAGAGFAVTIEPDGGVDAPTGPIVAQTEPA